MLTLSHLPDFLRQLEPDLVNQIVSESKLETLPADQVILQKDQYVKVIPIVLEGLIKVYSMYEDKELLLYYIKPNESCVMSFHAGLYEQPSRVFARTEEITRALLIPGRLLPDWTRSYHSLNQLFFQQYDRRYAELLDTIHHLIFDKLDVRLLIYLKEKSALTRSNPLKTSHRIIASELGTAREVVSRLLKKLEADGKVSLDGNTIKII